MSRAHRVPGRRRHPTAPAPARHHDQPTGADRGAALIRAALRKRRVDLATLSELARWVGAEESTLRAVAARHQDLGVCGPPRRPTLWSLPAAAIASGFRPERRGDQLVARLPPTRHGSPSLVLSGHHIGPCTLDDPVESGISYTGELGHTLTRLALMAHGWAAGPARRASGHPAADRWLFTRVAATWRTSPDPDWAAGELRIHRSRAGPDRIELLTTPGERPDEEHLLNLYPTEAAQGWAPPLVHRPWDQILPVIGRAGLPVGTGTLVSPGLVLTALHVIDPEPNRLLRVGDPNGEHPVIAVATLPPRGYRARRHLAIHSYQRARTLTGNDAGTVDLALLAVPGLHSPGLPIRPDPVQRGERVAVAGYPQARPTITAGPISGRDDADFTAHVLLGPGASGAPALDTDGRIAGVVTLDHDSAGAILIGPELVHEFVTRTTRLLAHHVENPPAHGPTPTTDPQRP